MMRTSKKRQLEGLILVCGGLSFMFLIWYGYFAMKKAELPDAIFASLAFSTAVLAGVVALTVKHDEPRWFSVDPKRLNRGQNLALGIGGVILAICSLWLAISRELGAFIQTAVRGQVAHIFVKVAFLVAFFYFCWHAVSKFKRAFQRK